VVFVFLADIFLFGVWDLEASGLPSDDPEIASLSSELRAGAASTRAPATVSSYSGPWLKFKSWCQEKGVSYLPAKPLTVALYLTKAHALGYFSQPNSFLLGCYLLASSLGRPSVAHKPPDRSHVPGDFARHEGRWTEPEETVSGLPHPSAVCSLAFRSSF
jgi:hypothetical protein